MGLQLSEYNLKQSVVKIGQLYPVLVAADGTIIDGGNRLKASAAWKTAKLPQVRTDGEKFVARIIANMCRRDVSKREKREWVGGLAEELKKEGVEAGKIVREISEMTGMSEVWVRNYIPQRFKLRVGAGSENYDRQASPLTELKDAVEDIMEEFRGVLDKSPERAQRVSETIKEELASLHKRVSSISNKSTEKGAGIVAEIDTGFVFTCPVCLKRYQMIHSRPSDSHKFQELEVKVRSPRAK